MAQIRWFIARKSNYVLSSKLVSRPFGLFWPTVRAGLGPAVYLVGNEPFEVTVQDFP